MGIFFSGDRLRAKQQNRDPIFEKAGTATLYPLSQKWDLYFVGALYSKRCSLRLLSQLSALSKRICPYIGWTNTGISTQMLTIGF